MTLDADVERELRAVIRQTGVTFKEALNDAIRLGLTRQRPRAREKFRQKTYPMGAEQYFRWEKTLAASDAIEDEEIVRKLSLRK